MIEKITLVDQIELQRTGDVGIRLVLLLVEDGVILASKYHRTVVPAGGSVAVQMDAVNANLISMGEAPVHTADLARLFAIAAADAAQPGRKDVAKTLRSRP